MDAAYKTPELTKLLLENENAFVYTSTYPKNKKNTSSKCPLER